ncbi:S8 family serine peptidase [Tepidiforma flava]|uniref:S8 family serine peptidase n=1 Tax=Tepidiforma flava TaxID=3004094 RepID=A0ABY7M9Z0_9CHLR|nr:S8 family serine peptidase [Tepidiforma flava]WBL37325.1 S8 family serine peptidase [Tepidiforma flava]
MRRRWFAIILAVAGMSAAAAAGSAAPAAADDEAPAPAAYIAVQFDTAFRAQPLRAWEAPPTLAEQGYFSLPVPPGRDPAEFAAEVAKAPNVLSAVPDAPVRAAAIPNDPYYLGSGSGPNQAQYLAAIGAPAAWDLHTGSRDVIVAVIDSGLDVRHPDFAGQLWENPIDNRNDGIDRDNNGCINDRYGCRFINLTQVNQAMCGYTSSTPTGAILDDMPSSHGTLVAGIIGAAGDNGIGIAGVAWKVRLLPIKALDCRGEGFMTRIADAIVYAVRQGARVINISIASDPPHTQADIPALRAALQLAQDNGVIVVAAAGNHSAGQPAGVAYPAAYTQYPNVIAVGAANNLDGMSWATYSNYGPAVDFAAPGNRLLSTTRTDIGLSNPYAEIGEPNGGFQGGTSFATPLVSGMFALLISRNSRLNAEDYIAAARAAATPAPPAPHGQNWAGSGIIDIGGAVARIPMLLTGVPQRDWRDVPGGTPIEARIGAAVCGSTTAVAAGPVSTFTLRVRGAAEQPGCGAPGAAVELVIGGLPAKPTITWGGTNADLGIAGLFVSSVSPPPGTVVVQTLGSGWSNLAHLEPTGALPGAASTLPLPWTAIYRWDPAKWAFSEAEGVLGAYRRFVRGAPAAVNDYPVIAQYDAYWVDAPAANVASLNPNPPPGRVVELARGWNNFVYTGQSRAVTDALSGIADKYTQVLQYDNASGRWLSYLPGQPRYLNDFGGLFTLRVYWIYMKEPAQLVMQ